MFESFVRERGLEFAPLEGEPRVMLQAEAQRRAREAGDVIPWVGFMRRQIAPILQQAMRDALAACAFTDAIITNQLGLWVGYHVAERLRLLFVRAYTWPGGLLVRGP